MTILVHRTRSRGITLLELVVAMVIVGIIATVGLVAYNGRADDKNLRIAAIKIEGLASKGHTRAFMQQTPHRLTFASETKVLLETVSKNEQNDTHTYVSLDSFSSDIKIAVRRWGAKEGDWIKPVNNTNAAASVQHWDFSSNGLCEPISIKLSENDNWIILWLDPLTGRIRDEESYIAN